MPAQIYMLDSAGRRTRRDDPLTGHRKEAWTVNLLNNQDVVVSQLLAAKDGGFTFNVNAVIRGGGSVDYSGPPIDWNKHRLQMVYTTRAGELSESWPIGVFLVATPSSKYTAADKTVTLELYDKLHLLDSEQLVTTYQAKAGTNIVAEVRRLLAQVGQTRTAIENSDKTLATPMVLDAGSTRLQVINELLEAANYFSLWADGDGVFRSGPYTKPEYRGIAWGFQDDEQSIYSPEFSHDLDGFDVPNQVVVVGQSTGDEPPPVAVVEDRGTGPFSIPTRERIISRREEGRDAADQATLQGIAERLLSEGQQVGSTYQIQHAPIPLEPNSVVTFQSAANGIDVTAVVQSISYSMTTGALCTTILKEVTS